MGKKKLLARSVVLGLLCSSFFSTSVNASTLNITDANGANQSFSTDYIGYGNSTPGYVIKISGALDKTISFPTIGVDTTSVGVWVASDSVGILNEATDADTKTIINDGPFYISQYVNGSGWRKSIENIKGQLEFNTSIDAMNTIDNHSGATMIFNEKLDLNVSEDDLISIDSASLVNNGTMKINNYSSVGVYCYPGPNPTSWYDAIPSKNAIYNSGVLEASNITGFFGNIKHESGAITNITLKAVTGELWGFSAGNIIGSNSNFHLTIDEYADWTPRHQVGEVEGVYLKKGSISLSYDNIFDGSEYGWNTDYDTLKLKNFKAEEGYLRLSTDLKNNVGDKFIFTGTTPSTTLNLAITNRDDNNGVPISPDEGKKVTVIEAPANTSIKVDSYIRFYGRDENYSIMFLPIVNEEIVGSVKNWNFVGWERSGNKTLKKESEQHKDGFGLNATEIDNTLKRLNDIRTDPSEIGVWVRGESGKMNIRSYGYDYNLMSGGYDWDYDSNAAKMFLGFGISYAKNNCDTGIIGNTKSMGYNLYGSWLGKENKDYVDVIVKYGTLDKDYAGVDDNNIFVKGDYDKNLFSIAAKYGRRIEHEDGWYWEPSVGLTWGRIGSADYTDSQGIKIHADSSTSKMASLGVQVGKNIKGTEYYSKFEVRHDFDGKMHVSVPDSNLPGSSVYDDMGGTWYKVGIGAARKIDKNNSFYIDIEKDFGNKVKKPYSIGAGYRYTW